MQTPKNSEQFSAKQSRQLSYLEHFSRWNSTRPYVIFLSSFALFQLYYFVTGHLGFYGSYTAYLVVYAALFGIFVLFVGRKNLGKYGLTLRRNPWQKTLGISTLLSVLFLLVKLEPGFSFGFAPLAKPTLFIFGFFLFSSPLVALSEESVYRGYIFRSLTIRMPFARALLLSSFLYGLQLTSISELLSLNGGAQIQYVFTNTSSGIALGIAMCFLFYKSGWSLLAPIAFRTLLLYQNYLSPIEAKSPNWELTFVFTLMAIGAVIVAINAFIREPKHMARRFLGEQIRPIRLRILGKQESRRETKNFAREGAAIASIVLLVLVVLPSAGFSSQYRTYAIASGSMVPTFYKGDLLITQRVTSPQQIQVGDIVAYKSTAITGTVTHRVISEHVVSNGTVIYITKGDNNPSPDPVPVPFSRIEGKAVYEVPVVGYLVLSPPLAVSIVVVIALLSLVMQQQKQSTERRRRRVPAILTE